MAIMVTGGNGFVGKQVLRELVRRGEIPISYDIEPPAEDMSDLLSAVRFVQGDVLNIAEVLQAIKRHDINQIIHLVSLLTVASQEDPANAHRVNVAGMVNILEAARLMDIRRIAYSSSLAVYGKTEENPITEDTRKEPISFYGATKLFCEHLGITYRQRFGIDFVAVRWPVVWGPGRGKRSGKPMAYGAGKFSDIIEKPARGESVTVQGGSQRYELIYVKDAALSIVLALLAEGLKHFVFNAGTESTISLQELAEIIKRYLPQAVIRIEEGCDYAVPTGSWLNSSRSKIELGFQPRFSVEHGVEDYLAYLGIEP